jgi:GntR family transcriptional regulator
VPKGFRLDPGSPTPLWSQIEEGIRRLVAAGSLPRGGAIPSVRELARDLRVNPATVSKAYQRLTDARVLEVRRGDGTYVAAEPPPLTRGERARLLREGALQYAAAALTAGAARDEAFEELKAAWADLARRKGDEA